MKFLDNLYLRIFLPFLLAMLLATATAWWIGTSRLSDALEHRLQAQLQHATTVMADGTVPLTPELLARLGRLLKARFLLIDQDNQPGFAGQDPLDSSIGEQITRRLLDSPHENGSLIIADIDRHHAIVVQRLLPGRSDQYSAVAAIASLADAREAAAAAAWWLGGAAVIGALVLAWLGHLIARGITRPVGELATMARRIAEGDRDVRASIQDANEIGNLAEALNRMAERIQAYEQEEAHRNRLAALGELAARVAHEIRNPLTAIKLQVQLLLEGIEDSEERDRAGALLDEVRRLELIVSGTLAVSRPTHIEAIDMDLNTPVSEVISLMTPQFAHRGIELRADLGQIASGSLDPDRFKQVVFNLLTNAADELTSGGIVQVSTSQDEQNQDRIVTVEDSGPGIDPGLRAQLFSGRQGDKASGLGVGLHLSRELIELHHGRIDVDASPALGGARFTIRLPAG